MKNPKHQPIIILAILLLLLLGPPLRAEDENTICSDMAVVDTSDGLVAKPINDFNQPGTPFSKDIADLQPYDFAWSSATKSLAFISAAKDNGIFVIDSKETVPYSLLDGAKNTTYRALSWSPDGRFLSFYRYISDDKNNPLKDVGFIEVYGLEEDASRKLFEPFPDEAFIGHLGQLTWSADGKYIAVSQGIPPYEDKIYVINTDCLQSDQSICHLNQLEVKNVHNWVSLSEGETFPSWAIDGTLWFICGGDYCIY